MGLEVVVIVVIAVAILGGRASILIQPLAISVHYVILLCEAERDLEG